MLLPQDPVAQKITTTRVLLNQVWIKYKVTESDVKSFMILLCSCVFNKLLSLCHAMIERESEVSDTVTDVESDDVYFRFGGAAIASMLHVRYDKIKTSQQKNQISKELTLLQKLSVHEKGKKEHISNSLKYRDEGYTYVFSLLRQQTARQQPTPVDSIYVYGKEVLTLGLLWLGFNDAIKEGDGDKVFVYWKFFLLVFKHGGCHNYSIEAVNLCTHPTSQNSSSAKMGKIY